MPRNVQTTVQLCSFHMLVRLCSKSFKPGFSSVCLNQELPDVKAGFKKGRETRDQIANIHWIIEKAREFQKNICFINYTESFDCVDHNKLWEILQARLQQYMNRELPNVQAGFRKGRGTRDQIASILWIIKKAREFQKNICFCFHEVYGLQSRISQH